MTYQPPPFRMNGAADSSRWIGPPQTSQVTSARLRDALPHFEDTRAARALVFVGWHETKEYMAIMRVSRSAVGAGPVPGRAVARVRDLDARRRDPHARSARLLRGGREEHLGGANLARLSSLRQAVEVEPRNSLYHNAVGAVLLNIGRHADAQAEFQKAVELDPTYADAYHNLGSAYAEQAKWEEAIVAYRSALAQTIYTPARGHLQQPRLRLLGARSPQGGGGGVPRGAPARLPARAVAFLARGVAPEGREAGGGHCPPAGRPGPRARLPCWASGRTRC